MIVIIQSGLPVQFVTLDLGYTTAGTMYQATTIIHSFARVDFSSTDSTSLVAHVISVMIVIIKCFWLTHPGEKQGIEPGIEEVLHNL